MNIVAEGYSKKDQSNFDSIYRQLTPVEIHLLTYKQKIQSMTSSSTLFTSPSLSKLPMK